MDPRKRLLLAVVTLGLSAPLVSAQADDRIAYMPTKAISRTADDERIGFRDSAVPGMVELELPKGTWRVDILDARGVVDDVLEGLELHTLDLDGLAKGTWTMRAHTPEGYSIRRFIVLQRGTVAWALPQPPRKR